MFSSIYDGFAIADDTIISYDGRDIWVEVPSKVESHRVKVIGSGAFMNAQVAENIDICEGIEEIKKEVFANAGRIKTIYIPTSVKKIHEEAFGKLYNLTKVPEIVAERYLTKSEYNHLLESSRLTRNGIRILTDSLDEYETLYIINRCYLQNAGLPIMIGSNLHMIILDQDNQGEIQEENILDFDEKARNISQDELVRRLIMEKYEEPYDAKGEAYSDYLIKMDEKLFNNPVITLITFNEAETRIESGKYRVKFLYRRCRCFLPSVKPIRYKGEMYYMYCKQYITDDKDKPIIRKDVEIYKHDGRKVLKELEDGIKAKYRLLAML